MKLFGAIIIVLCGGLIGAELFRRQVFGRDMLGEMQSLCLHMMSSIRYQRTEPEMIVRTFSSSHETLSRLCRERLSQGDDFSKAWQYMAEHPKTAILNTSERSLIRELGAGFGRSDAESELMRLQHIYEKLSALHQRRCSDCLQRGRSYITAGFLVGALIMIFMI